MVYAIKYDGKYLRFGSYSSATPVDKPENASLFSEKAFNRAKQRSETTHWIKRKPIPASEFQLVELEFAKPKEHVLEPD